MSIRKSPTCILLALVWLLAAFHQVHADTYTVTSPDDTDDPHTLRGAITAANQHPGPDTIVFNLLPAGNSITVFKSLNITDPVTIDGGGKQVVGAGQGGFALLVCNLGSSGSRITGLSLVSSSYGVWLTSSENQITRCRIGTDWENHADRGNDCGIFVASSGNVIGGPGGDGNVISGNRIGLEGNNALSLVVQGNVIGLDSTGLKALPNDTGIWLGDGTSDALIGGQPGQGNTLCGNTTGILLDGRDCSRNTVAGNVIGADAGPNSRLANSTGIEIREGTANVIGAAWDQGGNRICGNSACGILLDGSADCDANVIQNNRVGLASQGQLLGNDRGIALGGSGNLVGGDARPNQFQVNYVGGNMTGISVAGFGNTVSGNFIGLDEHGALAANGEGLTVSGSGNAIRNNVISGNQLYGLHVDNAQGGFIQGNFLGTDPSGTLPLPNAGAPLYLDNASDVLVGGDKMQERNIFCGSAYAVEMDKYMCAGNTLAGNWIGVLADGRTAPVRFNTGILMEQDLRGNSIGYPKGGPGNLIVADQMGIYMATTLTVGNAFYGNTICGYSQAPVILGSGAGGKRPPVIAYADAVANRVSGTAQPGDYIEIYSTWSDGSASDCRCCGWTLARPDGLWGLGVSGLKTGGRIYAMATDANNTTSPCSDDKVVTAVGPVFIPTATATATATALVPTATPSPAAVDAGVQVFPVPGKTRIHFLVTANSTGPVVVSIYNVRGERVASLEAPGAGSAPVDMIWSCGQAAAGIYLGRVTVDGTELAKNKLAVVR